MSLNLCTNIIGLISGFSIDYNYKLLSKEIYNEIQFTELSKYWMNKYEKYLNGQNLSCIILKGNYNWKYEFIRIINFNKWNLLSNNFDLINLQQLLLCND